MFSLISVLKNIGLSDKEALTYLTSLRVGTNPASVIAKNTEINRCTTYSILESLAKKGLVIEVEREKIKFFTAIPPKKLINYIDEKRLDLSYFKNEIQTLLPDFESIQHKDQIRPSLQSYSGKSSITQVYHSVVQDESLNIWAVPAQDDNSFFNRFAPEYLRQNKTLRIIRYSNNRITKFTIKKIQDLKNFSSLRPVEFITGDKVVIASSGDNYGIEIYNQAIVKYFQNKFDLCWKK